MMTDQAIDNIRQQLDSQGKKLDEIKTTLQHMAVQDEQIKQIQKEQHKMWKRLDAVCGQDGTISRIERHQASCPRKQIQTLWYVVIPMGVSQLVLAAKIVEMMGT